MSGAGTVEDLEERTYHVPDENMGRLVDKLRRIFRKCDKLGIEHSFEEIGTQVERVTTDDGMGVPVLMHLVRVSGTAEIFGWELVAAIDHTDNGNVIRKVSKLRLPERYLTAVPACDHCGSRRHRKTTYVIRNASDGAYRQVGKSCLREYTGGLSAEVVTSIMSIHGIAEACTAGPAHPEALLDRDTLLACAYADTRARGFFPARDGGGSTASSATRLHSALLGYPDTVTGAEREGLLSDLREHGVEPRSEEVADAVSDMLSWVFVESARSASDYMHNLSVACASEYVDPRHANIVASLPSAYLRARGEEDRRKALAARRRAEAERSDWVGDVGGRVSVTVTSCRVLASWNSCFDGYNERTTYLYRFTDTDGDVIVWRTAKLLEPFDCEERRLDATVKEHGDWKGTRQTVVTRARLS